MLFPVCAMVLLTMIVQFSLMRARVSAIKRARVHPQAIAGSDEFDRVMKGTENLSDHFENLFEMPVLFYLAAVVIATMQLADAFYIVAAWFFVIGRVLHSLIHCTYNKIMHRFYAYFLTSITVWVIWARLAYQLLR